MTLRFNLADAERANDEWGANCGPGALAAIAGLTMDEVRPHLDGFDAKRYTNPTMMYAALQSIGIRWELVSKPRTWPKLGWLASNGRARGPRPACRRAWLTGIRIGSELSRATHRWASSISTP